MRLRRAMVTAGTVVTVALACAVVAAALHTGAPPSAAATCVPLGPGTHRLRVAADRVPVVVHVPQGLLADGPVVLALPGAGQTAQDFARYTGYSRLADRAHVAVAYATASGTRPLWNVTDRIPGRPQDVPYLRAVIPAIARAACADPSRVGVTGVSNGGGMSARLACDASDLVAAAAPVAGGYGALPDCHPGRAVPILEIHGTADTVVPYAGRGSPAKGDVALFLAQWRLLDGCTGEPSTRTVAHGVQELRSTACADGTQVIHDRVAGAEHGWPGEDDLGAPFSATRRTFAFLSAFRR